MVDFIAPIGLLHPKHRDTISSAHSGYRGVHKSCTIKIEGIFSTVQSSIGPYKAILGLQGAFLVSTTLFSWFEHMTVHWPVLASVLVQIGILAAILYFIYHRLVQKTQAEHLLKGVFVVLLLFVSLWGFSRAFHLSMLEVVFGSSIQILLIGLIVIFQPELRRMLMFLGQQDLFGTSVFALSTQEQKAEYMIQEIIEAVRFLSKSKMGALIVLESPNNPGSSYLEAGTPLNARLTAELLLTIFQPKTPLHDGALVVDAEKRVMAAGVLLPLTEDPKLSWQYGTRHRAAIGLTEVSDSHCIVVSEETGAISLVHEGVLEKMGSADELQKKLERLYKVQVAPEKSSRKMKERISGFFSADAETFPERIQRIFTRRFGSSRVVSKEAASKAEENAS